MNFYCGVSESFIQVRTLFTGRDTTVKYFMVIFKIFAGMVPKYIQFYYKHVEKAFLKS